MSAGRIAIRYARPLLELAEEKKILDQVKADMISFKAICESDRQFVNMLRSPIIAHLKKADILRKIFKGKVSDLTLSVFDLIARKNRESVLPNLASEFLTLYNERMGIQPATVTTTIPLDGGMKKSIEKLVADASGKKPELKEKINSDIVGGFVLQLGDKQIDESISGKLNELKIKFSQSN